MPDSRPLLTVAIPTYNRSRFLAELLACLEPQWPGERVELLIADNGSTDDTLEMLAGFEARGLPCRLLRSDENTGPDANFLRCLRMARGKYVWVLGDDDLLVQHAVEDIVSLLEQGEATGGFDLVYLSSFGFMGDYKEPAAHTRRDRLGRFAEVVTDGAYFVNKVNALIGLISVMIVNKERLDAVPHPPIEELNDSNLLQVGWLFPLLRRRCRVLFVWERLLAYRSFNSGGWGICKVFGVGLNDIAGRYFSAERQLQRSLMNGVIRYWMPDVLIQLRKNQNQGMHAESVRSTLGPVFARNWRYWLFVYPLEALPVPLARCWHRGTWLLNKATRAAGAVWRHTFRRGEAMLPERLASGGQVPRG